MSSQASLRKNKKNANGHIAEVLKSGLGRLEIELERIKRKVGIGYEVRVEWLPGKVIFKKGRQLE